SHPLSNRVLLVALLTASGVGAFAWAYDEALRNEARAKKEQENAKAAALGATRRNRNPPARSPDPPQTVVQNQPAERTALGSACPEADSVSRDRRGLFFANAIKILTPFEVNVAVRNGGRSGTVVAQPVLRQQVEFRPRLDNVAHPRTGEVYASIGGGD